MGDRHLYGGFLAVQADFALAGGDADEAASLARKALGIGIEVGCPSCESGALAALAVASDAAEVGGAVAALVRSIELAAGIHEILAAEWGLHALAGAIALDAPETSALVLGGTDALRRRLGHLLLLPCRRAFVAARVAAAKDRVGAKVWEALVDRGRQLSYSELLDLAAAVARTHDEQWPEVARAVEGSAPPSPLIDRQRSATEAAGPPARRRP